MDDEIRIASASVDVPPAADPPDADWYWLGVYVPSERAVAPQQAPTPRVRILLSVAYAMTPEQVEIAHDWLASRWARWQYGFAGVAA